MWRQYRKGHPLYRVVNKLPQCIVIQYIITLLLRIAQLYRKDEFK